MGWHHAATPPGGSHIADPHVRRRWVLPAVVWGAILGVSSVPGDRLDPIWLAAWVSYLGHAVEYGLLGAALRWAAVGVRRPWAVVAVVGAVCGALDELWQSTVPGRHPSPVDLAIDVVAVTVAGIVVGRWTQRSVPPEHPDPCHRNVS